jgi:uncharacterized protein (TIGR03437 family)
MDRNRVRTIAAIALSLIVPAIIVARSVNMPPRYTGAPDENDCTACHAGLPNSGQNFLRIFTSEQYIPGETQSVEFNFDDGGSTPFGFQATMRPDSNPSIQVGRWELIDGNNRATVICGDGSTRPAGGDCPGGSPLEFVQHTNADTNKQWNVRWKAPDADIGPLRIYVSAIQSNGDGGTTGDNTYTTFREIRPLSDAADLPKIRAEQGVLQAFDFSERLSAGTHIQIFGENLSTTTRTWTADDFDPGLVPGGIAPLSLDGVSVMVGAQAASVSYVSPTQVNAVVADFVGEGPTGISIANSIGIGNSVAVTLTKVSPAMQQDPRWMAEGKSYVIALHQPDPENPGVVTYVGPEGLVGGASFRPAKPGEIITLFVLGAGTADAYPAGRIPETAAPLELPHQVMIGEMVASSVAVASPQFVGVFQFNVTVPNLGPGDYQITLTVDGVPTGQTLFVSVAAP